MSKKNNGELSREIKVLSDKYLLNAGRFIRTVILILIISLVVSLLWNFFLPQVNAPIMTSLDSYVLGVKATWLLMVITLFSLYFLFLLSSLVIFYIKCRKLRSDFVRKTLSELKRK